jgi:hypothetical protein
MSANPDPFALLKADKFRGCNAVGRRRNRNVDFTEPCHTQAQEEILGYALVLPELDEQRVRLVGLLLRQTTLESVFG